MRTISSVFCLTTLLACGGVILAQETATPPVQTQGTSVTKSCINMTPKAKQECLKVARQMDSDASAPETTSSSSSVDTVHHSSSVMQTAEEKSAAAKKAKPPKGGSKVAPGQTPSSSPPPMP